MPADAGSSQVEDPFIDNQDATNVEDPFLEEEDEMNVDDPFIDQDIGTGPDNPDDENPPDNRDVDEPLPDVDNVVGEQAPLGDGDGDAQPLGEGDDDDVEPFNDIGDGDGNGNGPNFFAHDEDYFEFEEVDDYLTILKFLSKEWIKVEIEHRVSHVASEAFWELGKKWFNRLFNAKKAQKITKKTPSFVHIRRQLHLDYVPPVRMDLGYLDTETGEVVIVEDSPITPKKEFPSPRFQKMWEIGHVKVKIFSTIEYGIVYCSKVCCVYVLEM